MEHQHDHHHSEHQSSADSYKPLFIILGGIIVAVIIIQTMRNEASLFDAMRIFMGLFFITFGFFKTLDWKGFADAYADYDIVAKRSSVYAYLYPLIELSLGVFYLLNIYLIAVSSITVIVLVFHTVNILKNAF